MRKSLQIIIKLLHFQNIFCLLQKTTRIIFVMCAVPNRPIAKLLFRHLCKTTPVSEEANAVVLGGGAVGTSIAYHLAKGGLKNVVLLESKTIASGSTAHTVS